MIFYAFHNIYLFLVIIPILVLMALGFQRRKKLLSSLINPNLWTTIIPNLSYKRRFWKRVFLILAFVFLVLSLMRPQFGLVFQKQQRS